MSDFPHLPHLFPTSTPQGGETLLSPLPTPTSPPKEVGVGWGGRVSVRQGEFPHPHVPHLGVSTMTTQTSTCDNCRFSDFVGTLEFGACRRYAPKASSVQDRDERDSLGPIAKWPEVHGDDWCGEWQRKVTA